MGKLLKVLCITLLMVTTVPLKALANTEEVQQYGEVKFVTVLKAEIPEGEALEPEVENLMQEQGWAINDGELQAEIPGGVEQVVVNEETLQTDPEGTVEIPLSTNVTEEVVELTELAETIPDREVKLEANETTTVEIQVDLFDFLESMDKGAEVESLDSSDEVSDLIQEIPVNEGEIEEHDVEASEEGSELLSGNTSNHSSNKTANDAWIQVVGVKPSIGHQVHCNRFNGPAGTGKYWPSHYLRAIANFAGSDCNLYIGASILSRSATRCMGDYISGYEYCAGAPSYKQARCSTAIGLKKTFHRQALSAW